MLLAAVLHFISDDNDPYAIVAAIRDALPPGSYLVLSHVTGDIRSESAAKAAVHYKKVASGATLRGREEILQFFAGLDLVEPGLVQVPRWRPDEPELGGCREGVVSGCSRAQAQHGWSVTGLMRGLRAATRWSISRRAFLRWQRGHRP